MQEYKGNAVNFCLTELDDGSLGAMAELIILTSEPIFTVDAGGEVVRRRDISQFRFSVGSKAIRQFIKSLGQYADAMDELEAKHAANRASHSDDRVQAGDSGGGS